MSRDQGALPSARILYEPQLNLGCVDIRVREGALAVVCVTRQGLVVPTTGFHAQAGARPVAGSAELPELLAAVVPLAREAIAAN